MANILQIEIEKMTMRIKDLANVLREGNYYYDKSTAMVEIQVIAVERQVIVAERQVGIA